MSQKSVLNIFHEENVDKHAMLENVFTKLSEEIDNHAKTKILHSFVHEYLLYFKDDLDAHTETTEFFELLSQIPSLCAEFLQATPSNGTASTTNLENKNLNLESASLCFDALIICLEAFNMTNQCVMLIKISLSILSQGYNHCKGSEEIYGELLEQFANELGIFFKKIENLQTIVLQQLDKLDITKYTADDSEVNLIVVEMGNLCQIVFSLDADIAFELWTKYLRIITDHKSLQHVSNINSVSAYLASKNVEVLQLLKYNSDKKIDSSENEELSAKFFFYLDALSSLMNLVHDSFSGNISQFRTFLLNFLDCLISCYSSYTADKTGLDIIKSCLVKNTFSLLSHLYADEEFLKSVLFTDPDRQFHTSILLLKLCSLQFIESSPLPLKENFLNVIFSDFISNDVEDDMKLLFTTLPHCTVTKTNSDEYVTLYYFAYEQITKFLKLMPDSVIKDLESTVLNSLISSSDIIYLLISDIWMYRIRCSSIEFLKDRCYTVLQNLHIENTNNDKIENFAKRMLRFLPCSQKDSLLEAFSSLKFIQHNKSIDHNFGIPGNTSTENEMQMISEEQVKMMMCKLNAGSSNDALQLVEKGCTCLELCTLFINVAESSEILQFLEFASEMFKTDVYEIQIATLTFVKSLSRKMIPEHNQEFGKIVTCLAQLFSEAMFSKNYIVRYEARNVFSYFAKCTPHIKIVQETVKRNPSIKPIMKSYISATPENNFLSEKEKTVYLNKQILAFKNVKFEIPPEIVTSLQEIILRGNIRLLN